MTIAEDLINHLEFLGFEIDPDTEFEEDSKGVIYGIHPTRWNIRISVVPSSMLISARVIMDPKITDLTCANQANWDLDWLKTFIDEDGDAFFSIILPAGYDRTAFGQALDRFENGVDTALKILKPQEQQ